MKHIILFIALFGVLLANAQEMDTTFVVNEQGQTVGDIIGTGESGKCCAKNYKR